MEHKNTIPQGMREAQRPSTLPFYFAGAVWLVFGLFLPMYKLTHLLAATAVSAAAWLVGRKVCKPITVLEAIPRTVVASTGNPELDQMRKEGADAIRQMQQSRAGIVNPQFAGKVDQLVDLTQQIMAQVEEHPKQLPKIRKFINYYLPTVLKLLKTYDQYDETPNLTQNISETLPKIERVLDTVLVAFQKQLDNLFQDQALDISTDITVLEGMLIQEGLSDSEFKLK